MKLPEQRKWKLFFYFSKNNNGVLIRKDKAPDFSTRGLLSFSVQSLLVRCGFQSPATQDKPIKKFNAFTVLTTCSIFLLLTVQFFQPRPPRRIEGLFPSFQNSNLLFLLLPAGANQCLSLSPKTDS
jgi:hypothetical protein